LLKAKLRREAARLGLHTAAFTSAAPASTLAEYEAWVDAGYHGEMGYLARDDRLARRRDLNVILDGVQSLVCVALPYWPGSFPDTWDDPMHGAVSCYAWGTDYHKILEKKLKTLGKWLLQEGGGQAKWYVDTGAIQERELGARSGLGFIGKNTLLIHPRYGSGVFLGELLTTLPLPPDESPPMPDCGRCQKCLDACPTDAFIGPYQLDARKCISYLTIELKGSIPEDLRPQIGNRIYGCDICQQVCPWNGFAGTGDSPLWGSPPEEVTTPKLIELMALDDEAFLARFQSSPIRRLKRPRLLRNVAVALGNSQNPEAADVLHEATNDPEPLIREHALWALEKLASTEG
jgi:epoxyqueuosine reductase